MGYSVRRQRTKLMSNEVTFILLPEIGSCHSDRWLGHKATVLGLTTQVCSMCRCDSHTRQMLTSNRSSDLYFSIIPWAADSQQGSLVLTRSRHWTLSWATFIQSPRILLVAWRYPFRVLAWTVLILTGFSHLLQWGCYCFFQFIAQLDVVSRLTWDLRFLRQP